MGRLRIRSRAMSRSPFVRAGTAAPFAWPGMAKEGGSGRDPPLATNAPGSGLAGGALVGAAGVLEADGLVERQAAAGTIAVTYRLTSLGADLSPHLAGLANWIETNLPVIQKRYKGERGG